MEKFNGILYFDILDFNCSGKFLTFKKARFIYVVYRLDFLWKSTILTALIIVIQKTRNI